jgi:hypothetical protein
MSVESSSLRLVKTSGISSMPAARLMPRQLVRDQQMFSSQKDEHCAEVITQALATMLLATGMQSMRWVVEAVGRLEYVPVVLDDSCKNISIGIIDYTGPAFDFVEVFRNQQINPFLFCPHQSTTGTEVAINWRREPERLDVAIGLLGIKYAETALQGSRPAEMSSQEFDSYVHPLTVVQRIVAASKPAVLSPSSWDE